MRWSTPPGGAYVPKADLDTKAQELTTANNTIKDLRAAAKAWDGKDPKKLEDDLKTLQTKYDTDTANIRRDAAIDLALTRAHARDPQLTRAALSMDDIKIGTDGKITGLDAQVESLKKDKAWLFEEDGAGQSGKQGGQGRKPERRSGRRLQSSVRRQPEHGKRPRFRSRRSIQHQRLTERRNEKCLSLSHRQRSGMANHVDQQVIDQFRRGSMLLEALTFDNSVSPGTGGSTLTYGYTQLKTPAGADFRDINTDYTDTVADRETKSVDLKIFGGTFKIDRVLAGTANGQISEVQFQLEEHIKATTNLFHYTAINGDKGTKGFDGLDTLLVGTSTELNADASKAIDLSTSAAIDTNYKTVLDMLDEFLSELDGVPTMLIGNAALLTKIRSCARRAGYLTHSEDAFGRQMSGYNGIPFMDMQYYYDTAEKKEKPVVPITSREYGASSSKTTVTGLTDLYAVRLGLDGFHAVSPMGGKVISTTLPDFSTAGAVKAGDVEMVAATVLKKSRAAGVLRNFKVK